LDLSVEGQEETKAACQKYEGVRVETYKCDITDVPGVRETFASLTKTLGPVDILVNNAGVSHGKLASAERFEDFWRAIEINFKGTMLCIYEVLQSMRERRTGAIINLASRAATIDMPTGLSYNSSKAAVARATSTLQEEFEHEGLGDQICAYSLHPGGVWGAMVTGACLFLLVPLTHSTDELVRNCRRNNTRSTAADSPHLQGRARALREHSGLPCIRAGKGASRPLLRLSA
jgi:NAD(P)-dependent dehydrogenase (short-subunit alcohol dehydrogenase family)